MQSETDKLKFVFFLERNSTIFGPGYELGVGDVGPDIALELTGEPKLVEVPVLAESDLLAPKLAQQRKRHLLVEKIIVRLTIVFTLPPVHLRLAIDEIARTLLCSLILITS